jgi:hypothetical protein
VGNGWNHGILSSAAAVQIEFKMEGGLAALPGLSRPFVIDTARLPPAIGTEIERLITAANFFDQPAPPAPAPTAADYRTFTITITDGTRSRSLKLFDPIQNTELAAMVAGLEKHCIASLRP